MTQRIFMILIGAVLLIWSGVAQAGTPYGPPGWNTAPDPCKTCQMPTKTQLPDNRDDNKVKPPPPPNPNNDPDVKRGIDTYKKPGS